MSSDADELFVVKLKGNPLGCRALANELIASCIAKDLGVPSPEGVIATIEDAFLKALEPGGQTGALTTGQHFGVTYLPAYSKAPGSLIYTVRNQAAFPNIVVFDILTLNDDRDSPDNFLICQIEDSFELLIIDHEGCFGDELWDESLAERHVGRWSGKMIPEIAECIRGPDPFRDAIARAKELTSPRLDEIMSQLPEEWAVSQARMSVLRDYLIAQAAKVEEIIQANRFRFPNWT